MKTERRPRKNQGHARTEGTGGNGDTSSPAIAADYVDAVQALRSAHAAGEERASLLDLFGDDPISDRTLNVLLTGGDRHIAVREGTRKAVIAAARKLMARDCEDCRLYSSVLSVLVGGKDMKRRLLSYVGNDEQGRLLDHLSRGEQGRLLNYLGNYEAFLRSSKRDELLKYRAAIEPCRKCQRPIFWVILQMGDRHQGHIYVLPDRLYLLLVEPAYARLAILRKVADPAQDVITGILLHEQELTEQQPPVASKVVFIHEDHKSYGTVAARELADSLLYNESDNRGILLGWNDPPQARGPGAPDRSRDEKPTGS